MEEPIEPKEEDCCGSGCNPCIFDAYQNQLNIYKKFLQNGINPNAKQNAISPLEYTEFVLMETVKLLEDHKILFLKLANNHNKSSLLVQWNPGDHFLIKFESGVACSRAYTPLNFKKYFTDLYKENDFAIVVKRYDNGLVSNYLYNLKCGQTTLWRGPYGSYEPNLNKLSRLIMIAQGTGVLPFLSIIDSILVNEDDLTKIILYYCCENSKKILFRDNLYENMCYWNFTYKVFVGKCSEIENYKYQEPIVNCKLNLKELVALLPVTMSEQFFICGSDQFMTHYQCGLQNLGVCNENIKLF